MKNQIKLSKRDVRVPTVRRNKVSSKHIHRCKYAHTLQYERLLEATAQETTTLVHE